MAEEAAPPAPAPYPPNQPAAAVARAVGGVTVAWAEVNGQDRYFVYETSVSYVIRALGAAGWGTAQTVRLLSALDLPLVRDSVRGQLSIGRRGGRAAALTPDQLAALAAAAGGGRQPRWGQPTAPGRPKRRRAPKSAKKAGGQRG